MTIIYQVKITQSAEKDIQEIWTYIAQDNREAAKMFITELENQFINLATFPQRCPDIPENELLRTDYKHLIYKHYRTIFRITKDCVYILRVIHGARLLVIET